MKNKHLREELVSYGRLIYAQGLVSGTSGNISVRVDRDTILVTPSGCHKGMLKEENLLYYDIRAGEAVGDSENQPSSEIRMHALVYQQCPDVGAVIHAHPPYVIALTIVDDSFHEPILPEAILSLGSVVNCGYATPTTEDVVKIMEEPIMTGSRVLILDRHGSVTLGTDLKDAYCRLETLEQVAKVTAIAKSIGLVTPLPKKEVNRLEQLILK